MSGVNVWGEEEGYGTGDGVSISEVNKKVSKSGDSMSGELDMSNNKIINLVNPTDAQDAATRKYVDNTTSSLFVHKAGDTMTGDLYIKLDDDTARYFGCNDISPNDSFYILLGNDSSYIGYKAPIPGNNNPIIIDGSGLLVRFRNNNIIRFGTSGADMRIVTYTAMVLGGAIDCEQYPINNLANPISDNDATTKTYVDRKICNVGYIPSLTSATNNKIGFHVTASTYFSGTYLPYYAFNSGDILEWCTAGITSNFWLKIQCPEPVAVGKFRLEEEVVVLKEYIIGDLKDQMIILLGIYYIQLLVNMLVIQLDIIMYSIQLEQHIHILESMV